MRLILVIQPRRNRFRKCSLSEFVIFTKIGFFNEVLRHTLKLIAPRPVFSPPHPTFGSPKIEVTSRITTGKIDGAKGCPGRLKKDACPVLKRIDRHQIFRTLPVWHIIDFSTFNGTPYMRNWNVFKRE